MSTKLPSVVIAGRPNVGKSTLFNRLTESRRSIVTNEPGITRDRIYGTGTWLGRAFEVVDTGGIVPDDQAGIPGEILRQARVAFDNAAQVVLVVDARAGVTPLDAELARLLRRTGKPLVIAVNKVDTAGLENLSAAFYELGKEVYGVSAEHGLGVDDLLDAVTKGFPQADEPEEGRRGRIAGVSPALLDDRAAQIRVAIIGRPNVGKSTLLNCLAGEERAIVSPLAGTTRDAVDTNVVRNGKTYCFVDTAGIRRKGKTKLIAEKLSVVMARRHLERADVALIVVDASQGVTSNDATIASYAQQSGRATIIVMNKWDLALKLAAEKAAKDSKTRSDEESERAGHGAARISRREAAAFSLPQGKRGKKAVAHSRFRDKARDRSGAYPAPARVGGRNVAAGLPRHGQRPAAGSHGAAGSGRHSAATADPAQLLHDYEKLVKEKLKFLDYAPVVFLSALTGDRTEKLFQLIDQAAAAHNRRVTTGELNRWLAAVDLDRGTSPAGRKIKIFYVTQASTAPPSFVLFTNQLRPLHFSYERFLENQLRTRFDFTGTPIRFHQRLKKR